MPELGAKPLATKLREKRNRPPGPFVWMTVELLESDAWRTAPLATKRFVERLMVEQVRHGGCENGKLIATFDQLEQWGLDRKTIKAAQADAMKRGLVYRTEKGCRAKGAGRRPHKFGLGWLPGSDGSAAPNRWKAWVAPAPMPKSRPQPKPALAQDIYSSGKNGTKLNGGNPRGSKTGPVNKVGRTELEKVGRTELGKKAHINGNRNHNGLPPGWKWGKMDDGHVRAQKPGTPGRPWIGVPVVEGTGDLEEQQAFGELVQWRRFNGLSERLTKVRPPDRVHPQMDGKPPASSGHFNA
jgi:hypothetical protein